MIPDVSIIVTNYNYGKYLPRCLRSCLNQKDVNFEVILVDDCSSDDSFEKIEPYAKNITLVKNKENLGIGGSSNVGLEMAKGQFVVRVDADDFINKEMCYFMKTYLEANHDAFCVSCDYFLVDDHENIIERKYASKSPVSCGIMYRKDLLISHGGYDDKIRHREEEELRKRIGEYYKIHHLNIPFYRYRMHNYNKTKSEEYKNFVV